MPINATPTTPITAAINRRFFEVINVLTQNNVIGGLDPFCKACGLQRSKYAELKATYGFIPEKSDDRKSRYKYVDLDALYYLNTQYGVSAEWLLTGRGKMFEK